MPVEPPVVPSLDQLRAQVQVVLDRAHDQHAEQLAPIGTEMTALIDPIHALLRGGKRLRAAFCYWGYRAAGGAHSDAIVQVATAMEVFQAAALLHDDVMDRSDTRRGRPTAHRVLAAMHREHGWHGDADRFGEAGAILAGDLCLNWTDELYSTSGLPEAELRRGRAVFDLMRTQLMGGQYLDVLESVRPWESASTPDRIDRARLVIRYKSAKYTVEQPLLIGATAFGVDDDTRAALSEYGLALGEAFQLRDDLLGVFGDVATTGKPVIDDIREGKRTLLVAVASERADPAQRLLLERSLGNPHLTDDDLVAVGRVLHDTGAVRHVEDRIDDLAAEALAAVETLPVDDVCRNALARLVSRCIWRDS